MGKEKFQPEESPNIGRRLSSHDEGKREFASDEERWFTKSDKGEEARNLGVFTKDSPITEAGSVQTPDTERMKFIVETARRQDQEQVEGLRQRIRKMFMRPEGARPRMDDEDTLADSDGDKKAA